MQNIADMVFKYSSLAMFLIAYIGVGIQWYYNKKITKVRDNVIKMIEDDKKRFSDSMQSYQEIISDRPIALCDKCMDNIENIVKNSMPSVH